MARCGAFGGVFWGHFGVAGQLVGSEKVENSVKSGCRCYMWEWSVDSN